MDNVIAGLPAVRDDDLMICHDHGIAYQADMASQRVAYDAAYLAKLDSYDGTAIAVAINRGRCAMLTHYAAPGANVLDVGACNGAFVRMATECGFRAKGYDVIPEAVARLKSAGRYADDAPAFDVITFWDSLEHMESPAAWFEAMRPGAIMLVAIPVFEDLRRIRVSRHYRPGEHLFYFTPTGFVAWMREHGFTLLGTSNHEVKAGRDSIDAFAFRKSDPVCECGGELQLERFDDPRRATEWFMRCRSCGKAGCSCADADEARARGHRDRENEGAVAP